MALVHLMLVLMSHSLIVVQLLLLSLCMSALFKNTIILSYLHQEWDFRVQLTLSLLSQQHP